MVCKFYFRITLCRDCRTYAIVYYRTTTTTTKMLKEDFLNECRNKQQKINYLLLMLICIWPVLTSFALILYICTSNVVVLFKEKKGTSEIFLVINKIETNTITARAQVWYKLWVLWCVRVISDQKFVKNKDQQSSWWTRKKNLNFWIGYTTMFVNFNWLFLLSDGLLLIFKVIWKKARLL